MTRPVPLFIEPCCGSAAVTLKLVGGPSARPPVSWQGGKQGYAEPILWALGLRSGQGADAVLLNDLGPWSMVWRGLCTPGGPEAVAEVIREWVDEDPRALWERLRDEPVPPDDVGASAAWLCLQSGNFGGKEVGMGSGRFRPDSYSDVTEVERARGFVARLRPDIIAGRLAEAPPPEVAHAAARALVLTAGTHGSAETGGFRGAHSLRPAVDGFIPSRDSVAVGTARIRMPEGCLVLSQDAATIDPRSVARWLFLMRGSFSGKDPSAGIGHPEGLAASDRFGGVRPSAEILSAWLEAHRPFAAATASADASAMVPDGGLPDGTVVYLDPDYQGTTGYAHTMPRDSVLETAERWRAAGAVVAVSEAEPLPMPGWHHVEITAARKGQRRAFSRQQAEWLTMSSPPRWRPGLQADLLSAMA